ncbi:MAG: hypothetical protein IPL40_07445 [Proteobacteria bacterium]|nr:hypothetical protein [Pseudomonadota bacterium]
MRQLTTPASLEQIRRLRGACAALLACMAGQALAAPEGDRTPPEGGRAAPAATAAARLAATAAPGAGAAVALEGEAHLGAFYARLGALTEGVQGTVRIVHFGDSHVAAAWLGDGLRRLWQQRFGDGGPGLLLVGGPWRSYKHGGARLAAQGAWRAERQWSRYRRGHPRPRDAFFGAAGISVHARGAARASVEVKGEAVDRLTLSYLLQPGGGAFELWSEGRRLGRWLTAGAEKVPVRAALTLPRPTRQLELRTQGGEVRFFGVDLTRAKGGLVYDGLGINGARADSLLQWDQAQLAAELAQLAPALLIFAYGSNELDARGLTREGFARAFSAALQRLLSLAGGPARPACLVLGVTDQARRGRDGSWQAPALLPALIEEQRRSATAAGCAFWDQRAAMGGERAVFAWADASPPLAMRDYLHLTSAGYHRLGEQLFAALSQGFARWQRHRD